MKACTDGLALAFSDFCNNAVKKTIETGKGVKSHFIEIDLPETMPVMKYCL